MLTEYTRRFLSSEVPPRPAEDCLFHVIPVPHEATVSYAGGTAGGPAAILEASDQLELLLPELPEKRASSHILPSTAAALPSL